MRHNRQCPHHLKELANHSISCNLSVCNTTRAYFDSTLKGQRRVWWGVYCCIFTRRHRIAIYIAATTRWTDQSAVDTCTFRAGYGAIGRIANIKVVDTIIALTDEYTGCAVNGNTINDCAVSSCNISTNSGKEKP